MAVDPILLGSLAPAQQPKTQGLPLALAVQRPGAQARPLRDIPKVVAGLAVGAARPFGVELGRHITTGRYGVEPPRTVGFNVNEPEAEALGERLSTVLGLLPAGVSALGIVDRALFGARAAASALPEVARTPAAQKLIEAIRAAKPIRAEQEVLYSTERSARIGKALATTETAAGEGGARQFLGVLKGQLPKAQYEPARQLLGATAVERQAVVDELFTSVLRSPLAPGYDKATGIQGLAKLLDGSVPQKSELQVLSRVFGGDFVREVQRGSRVISQISEAAGIPRAMAATLDLSAPLRQGLVAGARYPRQFVAAFGDMFKIAGREEAFTALKENIVARPTYALMRESGLALTGLDEGVLLAREEQFLSSLPERLPLVGRTIRASNRAYTGFLTKLRADVFDELLARSVKAEIPQTEFLHQSLAKAINAMTGRGDLGRMAAAGNELSTALFSPRLLASRLNLLDIRGIYGGGFYGSLHPFARKEALKGMLNLAIAGSTVLALGALAGGKVGTDPRSADFGKLRFGNTRLDIWGGFQQYPRVAAQVISGKLVSSTTGQVMTLGEGYRPLTRWDIARRFFESKANPLVGTIIEIMEGRTFEGTKPTLGTTAKRLLTPLLLQDLWDIMHDDPSLLPLIGLGTFGVGLQTYGPKKAPPPQVWPTLPRP